MKAQVEWNGAVKFTATSGSGHAVQLDGPEASGGENAGPRPMELILMGVGGCSAYDVVQMLVKGRQAVEGCVATVEGERATEAPKVYTKVHIHFEVTGRGLSEHRVAKAVELSAEKYCSASIMLARGGVEMTHSYEIVELDSSGSEPS